MIRSSEQISPALAAASVRDVFDPSTLSVPGVETSELMAALLPHVDTTTEPDGIARWTLQPSVRSTVLERCDLRELKQYLRSTGPILMTDRQRVFQRWIDKRFDPTLAKEPTNAIRGVASWLRNVPWASPSAHDVILKLARREAIQRLRIAAGPKFIGREQQLKELADVIDGRSPHQVATIEALGGMGKSAVIAQTMIKRGAYRDDARIVAGLLDFDASTIDPLDPSTFIAALLDELEPQVGSLESHRRVLQDIIAGGRSLTPDGEIASQRFAEDSRLFELVENLGRHLDRRRDGRCFVLVLDTLERALHRGGRVVSVTIRLLHDVLLRNIGRSSLVLAGRTVPAELVPAPAQPVVLGALPPSEAKLMLKSLGVPARDATRASKIVSGVPLTLRLTARVLRDEGNKLLDDPALLQAVKRERVNGYLYRRILAHLPDRRVRTIADPGLALRDLTPEAIVHILGERVKPPIAISEAQKMFDMLARVEDLFLIRQSGSQAALRVRPEVRNDLLALLHEASPDRLRDLHQRAVAHYRATNPMAAAYHLLQLGQLDEASKLVVDAPGAELADAVEELPAASAAWLKDALSRSTGGAAPSEDPVEVASRQAAAFEQAGRLNDALARLLDVAEPPNTVEWWERIIRLTTFIGDRDAMKDVMKNVMARTNLPAITRVAVSEMLGMPLDSELASAALVDMEASRRGYPEDPAGVRALLGIARTSLPEARAANRLLDHVRGTRAIGTLYSYDRDLLRRFVVEAGREDDLIEALGYGVLDRVPGLDLTDVYAALDDDRRARNLIDEAEREGALSRALMALIGKYPGVEEAVRGLLLQSMRTKPPSVELRVTDRASALREVATWIAERVPQSEWHDVFGKTVATRTLSSAQSFDEALAGARFMVNDVDRNGRIERLQKTLVDKRPDAAVLGPAFDLLGKRSKEA